MADKKIISMAVYETDRGYDAVLNEHGREGDSFNRVTDDPKELVLWVKKYLMKLSRKPSTRKPFVMPSGAVKKGRFVFLKRRG